MALLRDSLKVLRLIEVLELKFVWCINLRIDAIDALADGLSSLELIRCLGLNFHHCMVDDVCLETLATAMRRLVTLNRLELILSSCNQITNNGIQLLADSF